MSASHNNSAWCWLALSMALPALSLKNGSIQTLCWGHLLWLFKRGKQKHARDAVTACVCLWLCCCCCPQA
jgi:hypothetical protein